MFDYPVTRRDDTVDDYHGTHVADPYRWLEDADAPDTRRWIAEQNALTQRWLAEVAERDAIRERLAQLWDRPRQSAPWRRGERWFQLRNSGLQDQDVLWTMPAPDATGEELLDPNTLSPDGTVALTGASVTHDGRLLAYATSAAGSDWLTWRIREVETGKDLDDVCEWSKFSGAAWTHDGAGFYYARYTAPAAGEAYAAANRDQQLRYHRVGTPQDDDRLVYARPDQPEWGFAPQVTEDGRWLVLSVWHGTDPRNRVYYVDLAGGVGDGDIVELLTDFDAAYDFVGNVGTTWYFLTDLDAPRGRVIAIDIDAPDRANWDEVLAETDDTLEQVRLVGEDLGGRLMTVRLHHASHRVASRGLDGRHLEDVELGELGTVGWLSGRQADDVVHFTYETFTAPSSVYRHDLRSGSTEQVSPSGLRLDPEVYVSEQAFVDTDDGARVPVFLVHRRDLDRDGARPTLMYAYGGFRISLTPTYKVAWHVWLERGGVLAVANLRGGGEYGQAWHDAGRLERKQRVFDDFAAVGRWLVDAGWTRPERLAIHGGSNGGLLVGASLTQHPELFGAAVAEVGVFDMLRFHRFTIGWAWASDFGTADDPEQFATLHGYSPLHNLRDGIAYPATLLTTGDHDDRVVPAHSFKFAAALQAALTGDGAGPALIRIETDAGHGAGKPTSKSIDERADVLAFLTRALRAGEAG